jgi:hypothetical protein
MGVDKMYSAGMLKALTFQLLWKAVQGLKLLTSPLLHKRDKEKTLIVYGKYLLG